MARMEDTYVKCPYYRWEEDVTLCCECGGEDIRASLRFSTKEKRREYERNHCKRNWRGCPLASALTKWWEAGSGGK